MTNLFPVIFMTCIAFIAGLISSFLVSLCLKFGILDEWDARKPGWFGERCLLCTGFWFSVPFVIIFFYWSEQYFQWIFVLTPLASGAVAKWTNNS